MIISTRDEANPEKVIIVLNMQELTTFKEVQSLNRKLNIFDRFLFKLAKLSIPLFKILREKAARPKQIHFGKMNGKII